MSKESFKAFVRGRPDLVSLVNKGENTWQGLYEIYDLYGEDADIFKNLLVKESSRNSVGLENISSMIKNLDLETLQKGINGLEKTVGLLQDLTTSKKEEVNNYQERPIHKYYED